MMVSDYLIVPALATSDERAGDVTNALQGIYPLAPRKLTDPREQAWENLDTIIFDILNLTQGERDAVYEAVIELVENRLNKADSLSVSREQRKRIAAVEETLGIWIGLPEPQEPVEEHEENEDEVESFYANS